VDIIFAFLVFVRTVDSWGSTCMYSVLYTLCIHIAGETVSFKCMLLVLTSEVN
jgi:hypothetical protein